MQHPATSPSDGDTDDVDVKSKLLALLDRARVNRGLQPERRGDAPVNGEDATENASPSIKSEPTPVSSDGHNHPQYQEDIKPQCTCALSHQSSSGSMDAHSRIHTEEHVATDSGLRNRSSDDTFMAAGGDSGAYDDDTLVGSKNSHSRISSAMEIQTAGEEASQSDRNEGVVQSASNTITHSRVAILNSTPKPHIADLTGGHRERVPRLQQLRPLEVPRNNAHLESHEEKLTIARETHGRAQQKQPRKPGSPSNTLEILKNMTRLTVEEYEDSELHGDFLHMLHILIPSNATTALLERRGQPIQSISQQTGCTLSIREPEASPFKDDRLLRIYGKAKCISLAQRLVIAYIRAHRAEKRDPNYMDLSDETPPVALPATSITKAVSVAVSSGKRGELEITSPFNWMVQREDVGKMMGKQGSILASIRRDTGAAIHIDEDVVPGTSERRVILTGSADSIKAAIEEIKSRAGGRPEVAATVANGRLGQYYAIPYHAAGYLIGPQGSTVKSISERTGARLQIPSAEDLPLGSINRILHMQGSPKQTEHARRVVSATLRDYLTSPKCPRSLAPVSTGRKGDKVTIKVLLPSRICGFMLDQRGKLIREISDKSGAYSFFLTPHVKENRICVFTGDMSCVLRAQRLVLQVIAGDAISSKRIVPPRKRKRSHRDEEEDYAVLAGEEGHENYAENEDSFYDEDEYYDEGYEDAPRLSVRRQTLRQDPPRRPQHEYDDYHDFREDNSAYIYDDDYRQAEYRDTHSRQLPHRRPVNTRSREYIADEYALDEYDHHHGQRMEYEVPRHPTRQSTVHKQPLSSRRDDYNDEYEEYEEEYVHSDDEDADYEQLLPTRKQVIRRQPAIARDAPRQAVARPGRMVQLITLRASSREVPSRMIPIDHRRRNDSSGARPGHRSGSLDTRRSASRGGRGSGRFNTSRGRGRGSKRRRQ